MLSPDIQDITEQALDLVVRGGHAVVSGPAGSGRHSMMRAVAEREDVRLLLPPPLSEWDASGALVTCAARAVGFREDEPLVLDSGALSPALAGALRDFGGILAIRLEGTVPSNADAGESSGRQHRVVARLLHALARARRVLWVVDPTTRWAEFDPDARAFELHRFLAPLSPEVAPALADEIERVRAFVEAGAERPPYLWRAAAGAVALGASARLAAEAISNPPNVATSRIASLVGDCLASSPDAFRAALRLTTFRASVRREWLEAVVGADELGAALFDGLGYGDPVRVHPSMRGEIRRSLLTRAHSDDVAAAHVCAAGVWARADGATSPRALGLSEAAAWVEKVHHLGQGGAATYAEWLAQAMPSPEFYWDAARTLSMKREYDAAAALYRLCVEAFPRDPYAHHYLAYNLEQAGRRKADVRAHYRTACELDADNAWWNARYITHLISTHRWIDARAAWRRALEKIDPDGTLVGQHAWLVAHLHYWVAKAWADEGAWVEARSLLASIPGAVRAGVEHTRPLSALFARVDALRDQELSQFTEFLDTELDPTWRDRVREVWSQLLHHAPGIPAPAVSTDDDEARLIWSLSGVNIELGLEADGSSTWGAFDHLDQRSGGGESSTDHVTDELATWLRRARDHA